MALDFAVVRRVRDDEPRPLFAHQTGVAGGIKRVTTQKAAKVEPPQVTHARDSYAAKLRQSAFLLHIVRGCGRVIAVQDDIDLRVVEPQHAEVIVDDFSRLKELNLQRFQVDFRAFAQLVVSEHEGAELALIQMFDTQRADVRMAEFLGGDHAGMAGNDRVRLINHDRPVETEAGERTFELLDLFGGMFLGPTRVELQIRDRLKPDTRIAGADARFGSWQSSLDGGRDRADAVSYGRAYSRHDSLLRETRRDA